MKANELRLGNYLTIAVGPIGLNNFYCVERIDETSVNLSRLTIDESIYTYKRAIWEVNPIILTEGLILKLGFERIEKRQCSAIYRRRTFLNVLGKYEYFSIGSLDQRKTTKRPESHRYYYLGDSTPDIEYVHQLQNLYFAITGKELKVKYE